MENPTELFMFDIQTLNLKSKILISQDDDSAIIANIIKLFQSQLIKLPKTIKHTR